MLEFAHEHEMVRRVVSGEPDSIPQFFTMFRGLVLGCCRRQFRIFEDAEDASQEIFAWLLANIHRWPAAEDFARWLRIVCRNVCVDMWRKRYITRRAPKGAAIVPLGPDSLVRIPATEADDSKFDEVRRAVSLLPSKRQAVVQCRVFLRMTYGEIARTLAIHDRTARKWFELAKRDIAATLRTRGGALCSY